MVGSIVLGTTQRWFLLQKAEAMSYVRVSILGTAIGGEVWSINPTFDPTGEFPGGVDQTLLDNAALAIANISPGATQLAFMSPALSVVGARLEVRDDATNELIGLSEQGRTTPISGSTSLRLPLQSAVVCSLRTNTPGARGRGRIYWPACGATLDSSARISTVDVTALRDNFKTYFLAMRSALATNFATIGFDLAVRSRTSSTTPHVTRLQVGNAVDTQRRRRDKVQESYQTVSFP